MGHLRITRLGTSLPSLPHLINILLHSIPSAKPLSCPLLFCCGLGQVSPFSHLNHYSNLLMPPSKGANYSHMKTQLPEVWLSDSQPFPCVPTNHLTSLSLHLPHPLIMICWGSFYPTRLSFLSSRRIQVLLIFAAQDPTLFNSRGLTVTDDLALGTVLNICTMLPYLILLW